MKPRTVATAGMLIALQVITLLIAYIVPTIKLALLFASSVYSGILIRIGFSKKAVTVSFFAASILTVFLIQIAEIQAAFIAFFGWYGLIHEATKNMGLIKKQAVRWLCFLASAALMYIGLTYIVPIQINYSIWIITLAFSAAFILMQFLYEFTVREFIIRTKIKLKDGKIVFK